MPGEHLLLHSSTLDAAIRHTTFLNQSGLPADAVLTSPVASVPLPTSNVAAARAAGTWSPHPDFLWHPLLWLPDHMTRRLSYTDPDDGRQVTESDELWTIRVALELTATGHYDPHTGTWTDVLALAGLDTRSTADRDRATRWLTGANDPALDRVDLTAVDHPRPYSWALTTALLLRDDITEGAWALAAHDLLQMTEAAADHDPGHPEEALASLAGLAAQLLPGDADPDADGCTDALFFTAVQQLLTTTPVPLPARHVNALLGETVTRIAGIRDTYWPSLARLAQTHDKTSDRAPFRA